MNLPEMSGQPERNLLIEVQQSLHRLHVSLKRKFCNTFLQASSSRLFERLNWENPRQEENETVLLILKRLNEKLQEESLHGRETFTLQLLKQVFSHLWTYVLFNQGEQRPGSTRAPGFTDRRYHDQGSSNVRQICDDCEAVIQTLQQQAGVHQNELYEGCCTLNQALNRILCYLKQTIRQSQSQTTRNDEVDEVFEETDGIPRTL